MGSFTKLSPRDEGRAIEGGVALNLERYTPEAKAARAAREIFEVHMLRRKAEVQTAKFSAFLSKQARHDLSKLDRHQIEVVGEKIKHIVERPMERGDEKYGLFRGYKSLKVDGTSHVILFKVNESDRSVVIAAYGHHDVIYNKVPNISGLIGLDQWVSPLSH